MYMFLKPAKFDVKNEMKKCPLKRIHTCSEDHTQKILKIGTKITRPWSGLPYISNRPASVIKITKKTCIFAGFLSTRVQTPSQNFQLRMQIFLYMLPSIFQHFG